MRRVVFILGISALVGCGRPTTSAAPTVRQEMVYLDKTAEDGFTTFLPGTPTFRFLSSQMHTTRLYEAANPGVKYEVHLSGVQVYGMYAGPPHGKVETEMLEKSRDRFLKSVTGTLVYSNSCERDLAKGLEFMATVPEPPGAVIKARIYHYDMRIYGFVATGERAVVNGPDVGKFFDTIQITAARAKPIPPRR